MKPDDPFHLQRFVAAQEGVFDRALAEIRDGQKITHWMWFIFPQLAGLGRSAMARQYAIGSRGEARAYLDHGLLGARLVECAEALLKVEGRTVAEIFGDPDDLKLHSSMTLFECVAEPNSVFVRVLEKYFAGRPDEATRSLWSHLA